MVKTPIKTALLNRPLSRRDALRVGMYGLGVGAGLLATPLTSRGPFSVLAKQVGAATSPHAHPERILVVVELSGGNDGVNTIIPYSDDAYYHQRPTIGIPAQDVRKIDAHFGFHPAMAGFEHLYKDGKLAIVHACGYDNPILSHFASMGFLAYGQSSCGRKSRLVGPLGRCTRP